MLEKDKPCSSLDHDSNLNPNKGIQYYGFNYGIWVLMEMCNIGVDGYTDGIDQRSVEDLKGYRLRLFNYLIQIYEVTQVDNENNWLFEWKENKVLNEPTE